MWQQRVIIVYGATGGFAERVIPFLAEGGASLVLVGRNRMRLKERRARIEREFGTPVTTVAGDIRDASTWQAVWDAQARIPGEPFGWVCLVGDPARIPVEAWTVDRLCAAIAVNAVGPLLALHDWARRMRASGYAGNGILFASMQGVYPFEKSLPYALGKSALIHGARILAKEFGAPPPIRINVIAPGVTEAGMALASIARGKYAPYVEQGIIPRYGHPDDVVRAVGWLLTPDLYMTGQVLVLDGGLTLRRDLRSSG